MNTFTRHTLTNEQSNDLIAAATFRDYLAGRPGWPATEEQRVKIEVEMHQAESRVPEAVLRAALTEAPLMRPEQTMRRGMFAWLRYQNITD